MLEPFCDIVDGPENPGKCTGDGPGLPCCPPLGGDVAGRLISGISSTLLRGASVSSIGSGQVMPVDLATGLADVSVSGLGYGGMGPAVKLRWSNAMSIAGQIKQVGTRVGDSWFLDLSGRIMNLGNGRWVAFFQPTGRGSKYYFNEDGSGNFVPEADCNAELVEEGSEYWLMLPNGSRIVFSSSTGYLHQIIAASGIVTDFIYSGTKLTEVITKRIEGSNHVHNSLVVAYPPSGGLSDLIESITERSYVGTSSSPAVGDYVAMARMEFEYPAADIADRCPAGQLYRIRKQTPTDAAGTTWTTDSERMFVYYMVSNVADSFKGAIKYVIDENGYASLGTTPSANDLANAASAYFEYDGDDQMGNGDGTRRITHVATHGGAYSADIVYSDNENNPAPSDPYNHWYLRAVYTPSAGLPMTVYSSRKGDLLKDVGTGSDRQVFYTVRDSNGRVIESYTPAAIDMAAPYDSTNEPNDLGVGKASSGLVNITNWYDQTDAMTGAAYNRLESNAVRNGTTTGADILLSKVKYSSHSITTSGHTHTIFPIKETIQYQSAASGGSNPSSTTFDYTWNHTGTLVPDTVTTNLPNIDATTQNGVSFPQNDTTIVEIDEFGRTVKSTDARGTVTEYSYDATTGANIKVIRDSGSGKLNLTTDMEVNVRGRVIKTLGPVHDVDGDSIRTITWDLRVDEYESRTASGYLDVSSSNETLINPVSITKRSADGTTVDRIMATRGSDPESAGELTTTDSLPQTGWTSWSQDTNDVFGRLETSHTYYDIPSAGIGTHGTNFVKSSVKRDSLNRVFQETAVDGTISITKFDSRGLPVSQWMGTNADGVTNTVPIDPEGGSDPNNNMVKLSETEYDEGNAGGNHLVTKVTTNVNAISTDDRITEMEYDWRSRLVNTITTDGTNDFHQKPTLDNLGRAIESKIYRDDSGTLTLISQSESFYDDRGRGFRSKTYAVSDAGVAGNALESNQWFDANGQVIKASSPGSRAFTKTEYDDVGRVTKVSSAYSDGTGTEDLAGTSNDIVLTESISEYNDASQLLFSTKRDRLHDATGKGPLKGPGGSQPQSRDSYMATWYDGIGRARSTANYGTAGGSAPTRPASAPSSSDTIHVSQTNFDVAGRASETIDAIGAKTSSEFADDGLTTKVITNSAGTETQTVRMTYDNSTRQLLKQIAENVETGDQETAYAYSVTLADSDVANNSMMSQMTHPDGGIVVYTYDRTGQRTSMTDPNDSVHAYEYDKAGRRIADRVTLAVGSVVDDAVLRIEHSFDDRMRLQNVTSFDAATAGSVTSDVRYQYNDFGQVTKEFQQIGSAVNVVSSPSVQYNFEDGSNNSIRQTSITYPDVISNIRQLDYVYGVTGSQNDLLDRVGTIDDSAATLISYQYSGSGSVVSQTYNEPGISQTIATGSGSDPYASLDRFGRLIDLNWKTGTASLVGFEYGYDRMSNRLFERNLVDTGVNADVDSLFGFDSLNRMTSFETGELNGIPTSIGSPSSKETLTLDETGNISAYKVDFSPGGIPTITTLDQTRTHNDVNEVIDIAETAGDVWATPAHDANGNMNRVPQPYNLVQNFIAVWDAWNRLVMVKDGLSKVESYAHDGLNRRIEKKEYGTRGKLLKTTHFLLSLASQVLEERVDSSIEADQQFVWGLKYVDHLVLRDRDTNNDGMLNERLYALPDLRFCVMALTDDSGTVVERFRYDAHGAAGVMDVTFVNRTVSSYDWQYLYTGRREDLNTGFYFFRARYYHAQLDRFISRDPLGFVDGMSLYRGYFVPGKVDSNGFCCCCCVEDLRLFFSAPYSESNPDRFGHVYTVTFSTSNRRWNSSDVSDCKLEWWEKTNLMPPRQKKLGYREGDWNDLYDPDRNQPEYAEWYSARSPDICPSIDRGLFPDHPYLDIWPGRSANRRLQIAIKIISAEGCGCEKASLTVYADQTLNLNDGRIVPPYTFETGTPEWRPPTKKPNGPNVERLD